jgi:uncharacterized protein YcbX
MHRYARFVAPVAARDDGAVARSEQGGEPVGTVGLLSRFPVKSTAGEALAAAVVTERGLVGDREWAVFTSDGGIASGKNSHRFRLVEGLLDWRSTAGAGSAPELRGPGGDTYRADDPAASDALSLAFNRRLELRREAAVSHYDQCPVHLVTASSMRRVSELVGRPVDPRRLRANIVLDTEGVGFLEDDWVDAELAIGPEVVLRFGPQMVRCLMVDRPQVDVSPLPRILVTLGREHDVLLGIQAHVVRTGTISLGDHARLLG